MAKKRNLPVTAVQKTISRTRKRRARRRRYKKSSPELGMDKQQSDNQGNDVGRPLLPSGFNRNGHITYDWVDEVYSQKWKVTRKRCKGRRRNLYGDVWITYYWNDADSQNWEIRSRRQGESWSRVNHTADGNRLSSRSVGARKQTSASVGGEMKQISPSVGENKKTSASVCEKQTLASVGDNKNTSAYVCEKQTPASVGTKKQTSASVREKKQTSTSVGKKKKTSTSVRDKKQTSTSVGKKKKTSTSVRDKKQTSTSVGKKKKTSTSVRDKKQTSTSVRGKQTYVGKNDASVGEEKQTSSCIGKKRKQTLISVGDKKQSSASVGHKKHASKSAGKKKQTSATVVDKTVTVTDSMVLSPEDQGLPGHSRKGKHLPCDGPEETHQKCPSNNHISGTNKPEEDEVERILVISDEDEIRERTAKSDKISRRQSKSRKKQQVVRRSDKLDIAWKTKSTGYSSSDQDLIIVSVKVGTANHNLAKDTQKMVEARLEEGENLEMEANVEVSACDSGQKKRKKKCRRKIVDAQKSNHSNAKVVVNIDRTETTDDTRGVQNYYGSSERENSSISKVELGARLVSGNVGGECLINDSGLGDVIPSEEMNAMAASMPRTSAKPGLVTLANGDVVLGYLCGECNKLYQYDIQFYLHRRKTHDEALPLDIFLRVSARDEEAKSNRTESVLFGVEESSLVGHDTKSVSVDTRGRGFPSGSVKQRYQCSLCQKMFRHTSSLNIHTRSHTGEKPAVCKQCGKRFVTKGNLDRHMRIHTGEKPFICGFCGMRFSRVCLLKSHVWTHTGLQPYHCPVCGKGFGLSHHLHTHLRIHTGEKPYKCTICGLGFSRQHHMKSHVKTHLVESGDVAVHT